MSTDYVPDRLYQRIHQPWTLPESEWPLCKEDRLRVATIGGLPWEGTLLDVGAGDGTLAAHIASRNPNVGIIRCVEPDEKQIENIYYRWFNHGWRLHPTQRIPFQGVEGVAKYDGALCCEVLEHLMPEEGHLLLCDIKRAMRKNGLLCVTVPDGLGTRATYPGHVRKFYCDTLKAMLRDVGFENVWTEFIGPKHRPIWIMATARA